MSPVCTLADTYNAGAQPGKALALIDRTREAAADSDIPKATRTEQLLCTEERSEALSRLQLGADLATAAGAVGDDAKVRDALPGLRLTEARLSLPAARTCTGGDVNLTFSSAATGEQRAAVIKRTLGDQALACDGTALTAPGSTFSEDLAAGWKNLSEKYLSPLTDPLIGALAFLAAGVVLALLLVAPLGRLTTSWFVSRHEDVEPPKRIPREAVELHRVAQSVGWAALIATAAWVLLESPSVPLRVAGPLWVAGVLLLGWGLSQSLRMRVKVADAKGDEDRNASAHVATLVRALSEPDFRRLETAAPADETALQQAGLTTTPEGKVAAAVYRLLELLVPRTPWVVNIQAESKDTLLVSVRQHGRTVTSAVVDRDLLGLRLPVLSATKEAVQGADDKPVYPDLYALCAAAVAEAIGKRYQLRGLDGASTWQGVGLHYLARTSLRHQQQDRVDVLTRGLTADPKNRPLLLELWSARFRTSQDPVELDLYAGFLNNFVELRPMSADLRARALFARYVALINRYYSLPRTGAKGGAQYRDQESLTAVKEAIGDIDEALTATAGGKRADKVSAATKAALTDRLLAARHWCDLMEGKETGYSEKLDHPWTAYSWACFYASRAEVEDAPRLCRSLAGTAVEADRELAVRHLMSARAVRELSEWIKDDPQMATLITTREYQRRMGREPKSDIVEVRTLVPHKDALVRLGATSADAILALSQAELAALLQTSAAQASVVRRTAALDRSVPDGLGRWRYEIVDLLVADGHFDIAPKQHPDLAKKLDREMGTSLKEPPDPALLTSWLGGAEPARTTDRPQSGPPPSGSPGRQGARAWLCSKLRSPSSNGCGQGP